MTVCSECLRCWNIDVEQPILMARWMERPIEVPFPWLNSSHCLTLSFNKVIIKKMNNHLPVLIILDHLPIRQINGERREAFTVHSESVWYDMAATFSLHVIYNGWSHAFNSFPLHQLCMTCQKGKTQSHFGRKFFLRLKWKSLFSLRYPGKIKLYQLKYSLMFCKKVKYILKMRVIFSGSKSDLSKWTWLIFPNCS